MSSEKHDRTRSLWEDVFSDDTEKFLDYYYSVVAKNNQIYTVEEDGAIQSMLHLNPYPTYIEGQERLINYIVGVATRSSYRKRGYMEAMLRLSLKHMYQKKEPFTFLMPAAEAIYSPYDFVTVSEQTHYEYQGERDGRGMPVVANYELFLATADDCKELAITGEQKLVSKYSICTKRDTNYYERLLKEQASQNGGIVLVKKSGALEGYFIMASEGYLQVREPVMKNEMVKLETLLNLQVKSTPKIMIRIVNLLELLNLIGVRLGDCKTIEVIDPILDENTGVYVMTRTLDGVSWSKVADKVSEGLALSISDITRQIFSNNMEILLNEIV